MLSAVFKFGFKANTLADVPFFAFMFTGMVVFSFFSSLVLEGTGSIRTYSYLVKKVSFDYRLILIARLLSLGGIHLLMILLLFGILIFHDLSASIFWIGIVYYSFATFMLAAGVTLLTSSVSVFVPDIRNVMVLCMQFLFYLSPVFWSPLSVSQELVPWLELNPLYFLIQGYRDCLLYGSFGRASSLSHIYFWLGVVFLNYTGSAVFRRLRPHFADVL